MKNRKKAGFTLVELMVVAAIIAILAAIIIPLLTSNKDSAIAAEAANICGALGTEMTTYFARTDTWPTKAQLATAGVDKEINKGRYFTWDQVSSIGSDPNGFSVTISGEGNDGSAGGKGFSTTPKINSLTLSHPTANAGPVYSGSMVTAGFVSN